MTVVAEVYMRVLEDDPEATCYYLTELQLDVAPVDPADFRYRSTGRQPVALILLNSPAFSCVTTKLAASQIIQLEGVFRRDAPSNSGQRGGASRLTAPSTSPHAIPSILGRLP